MRFFYIFSISLKGEFEETSVNREKRETFHYLKLRYVVERRRRIAFQREVTKRDRDADLFEVCFCISYREIWNVNSL